MTRIKGFPRALSGRRGYAVATVTAVLGLLSLVALSAVLRSQQTFEEVRTAEIELQARLDVESALEIAITVFPEQFRREFSSGAPVEHELVLGPTRVRVLASNERSRVDLNLAEEPVLTALFVELVVDDERARSLAARIVDWRDADDLTRPDGAELPDYLARGLPYPGNRPFLSVAELSRVWGISPRMAECLEPHVTVHAFTGRPAPPLATPEVERALAIIAQGERSTRLQGNNPQLGRVYRYQAWIMDGPSAGYNRFATIQYTGKEDDPYLVLNWGSTRQHAEGSAACADVFE